MADRAVTTSPAQTGVDEVLRWIELLASEIGPRRPTGRAERIAAEAVRAEIASAGVPVELEPFRGYSTFALPFGAILGAAIAPALLPPERRVARGVLAGVAAAALAGEGALGRVPLSRLLSTRRSQNVVAAVEPRGQARRTLCLVSHLDSSRSGLIFHPAFSPWFQPWLQAQSAAVLAGAAEPLLARLPGGEAAVRCARAFAASGLGLLFERELRGADTPGANDNASGAAIALRLFLEHSDRRLEGTRLVFVSTGCEESGLLGMHAFLRAHDTADWLFLNLDSVGGPATVRYLAGEGIFRRWPADAALLEIAGRIERHRPDLRLARADRPAGLTYDVTPVLARGGRALTLSAQDETIPNYHRPTDTAANVDRPTLLRTLEAARELIAAIDRGEADPREPA